MSSYNTIETPQDYVNYTFNITSRGITEVTGELAGLSNTVTTILGQLAFKTSEYLTHTESLMISMGAVSAASFASATKEAMKFEQAIANVQAIGGESINAMQIGQAAMQYSNQFGMDVNSMTEGLEALSRAGLSATNVMSGVLAEGVKLSKLEGMDLEDSINDLISSTNLLAETDIDVNSQEYANAVKAMNQHIVSTSESSPINAQNIMQSLQHVGGYVSSNKIDQDDLFAVIAQLGAKGTKGEMAGTALRAFVAAGQKDQAQRALSRIGLDVSDLWDESGEAMLPISEMKDVLDNALEARGYSKQEKLEFYADFVGYKQANQIMKIDSSEVQQYKETIAHAWDLGKKLDTILGTTHNNMQILFQTIKNFMTKVGQSTLPILNAIVTPIKWGVQLLDAMPFSENITGMILAFGTLKAILLIINRVVPSIASMYTSFSSGEEKAKGIAGHFKNMYNDLTKSYDILTHITDSKYLSKIRVAEGFMGQQSYKQHQYVTQEIYKLYTQDNPNADKWFELAPIERELFESLTEAMKDTEVYKNIEGKYKEKSQKEALNIITFMENPQRASVTYGESKQDINKRISEKTQANNDAVNVSQQLKNEVRDFAQELNNSLIKKAETQEEKDITSAILNTKEALAEAIGRSVAQSFRTREVEVSKDLGSFEIDKRVASGAIKQLQEIEAQVSNELGDIGYFLKDDIDAIDNLISTVRYDLQQKISAYSNTNPSYMNHVQEQRMEKGISRAAKTNLGLLYSSEQNNIDILNVLRNNKWNRPNDSRLGIRDAQMDAIEEALHMDSGAGNDRDTRLTNIHNKLQSKYEGKAKEAKIAEILEKTEAIWLKAEKEKEVPSVVASRHLTDARAQHIGNAIGLGGFNWAQIDNAADVLTEYFKDARTNPKKQQELKRADKMLFSFLEEAKGAGEVFNAAEVEELGYLIRRYKQLMAARVQAEEKANKSFDKSGGWMNPLSANAGPKQAYRENIKNGGGFYPNADLSQFSWKDNFENFMQTAIINAFDAPVRNKWGISYGSEIEINPAYIKDTSQAFFSDTLNTLLHESAHSILQHQERDIDTTSSLYIGNSENQWRGIDINVIAELEASMVANLAMQKMGIDVEKDQIRQEQELLKLWSEMGEPDGLLSFADLNHLADEMANHVNDFVEMTRTLMDVAKSQEVLSNIQPSNVLTEKEKAKLVDIENRFASIRKKRTVFATGPSFNQDDNINFLQSNTLFVPYKGKRYFTREQIMSDDNLSPYEMQDLENELSMMETQNQLGSINNLDDSNDITSYNLTQAEEYTYFANIVGEAIEQVFDNIDLIDNDIFIKIHESIQQIYNVLTEEPISNELTKTQDNQTFAGTNNFIIQGDFHIDSDGTIIPKSNVVIDLKDSKSINTPFIEHELSIEELKEIFFAPIISMVNQISTDMENFLDFAKVFSFFKKGTEIIQNKTEDELKKELNHIAGIMQQQEHMKNVFANLVQDLLQLSATIQGIDTRLTQLPESNGVLENLRKNNKENRKRGWRNPQEPKDSGEEIIIGSYYVPGALPKNLAPGGYPQTVKDQIEENRRNRLKKYDDEAQSARMQHIKRESDNTKAMNDFLNMAHNMRVDLATKHALNPASLNENELDFIGLNKNRDKKRTKQEPTLEDYNKQLNGFLNAPNRKQQGRFKSAQAEIDAKWESTKNLRVFGGVIANNGAVQGPLTTIDLAEQKRNQSAENAKAALQRIKERNRVIKIVEDNFITQDSGYVPIGGHTGLQQAALIKEQQEKQLDTLSVEEKSQREIREFYAHEKSLREKEHNIILENENKKAKTAQEEYERILTERDIRNNILNLDKIIQKAEEDIQKEKRKNIINERLLIDELNRKFNTGLYNLTDEELSLINKGEYSTAGNSKVRADALQEKRRRQREQSIAEQGQQYANQMSGLYDAESAVDLDNYQYRAQKEARQRKKIEENKHIAQQQISQYSAGYDAENIPDIDDYKYRTLRESKPEEVLQGDDFWREIERQEKEAMPSKVEQANAAVERYRRHQEALQKQMQYQLKQLFIGFNEAVKEAEEASKRADNVMLQQEAQRRATTKGQEHQKQSNINRQERQKYINDFWAEQERLEKEAIEEIAVSNAGQMFNNFDNKYAEQREYKKQFDILSKVNEDIEKNRAGYKVKNTAKDIRQFIDDAPGKGISFLGNLLGVSSKGMTHKDVKQEAEENDYLGKTSAKITELHESLKPFNQALYQAGEIFPPFTIAAATMSKTMSALTMVAGALNFIEQLRLALLGEEYIAEEGSLTAKLLGIAATWAASNSEAALTGARIIGQIEAWKTTISETVLGAVRAFINGPLLLPIIAILAAIAATLATLYFWEKQHANALKETQEQLQKATAENNIAMSQYKDLKKAREAETDAIKRQQKARKEAIALYELEAARVKRRRLVHEEANLRNDAVWGEYGLRAAMQKMGLGFIAGGDFQSQYEQYDGTTKNIRQIKEETVGNLFATSEQRQVASVYDNNKHFFAEVEAYKEPLQALYDTESKLIEKYGSIDDARASREFYDAVQDFADATGINGKTAAKMLDWLETENKVNQATQAMQAQADVIVARADAKALAAEVGSDDFSDEGLQNAMIYAQASSIYQDAYDKLWWDWFGNTLFYILYSMLNTMSLGFGWGKETSEYAQKQEAYAEGMRELAELGVAGLAEVGENTAEHAERRDYGNGGGVNYGDTPFGGAKAAMAESYADQKQKEDYQKYGVVYSNDEYNDLQENHDVYLHSHLQASVNDSLAQEKTYVDNETQALEQSLNQGMNQAGQQGVQGFKDGLDQHSPGAISRSVQDEMIYSSDFIVKATPQLSKDTKQLGIQMSNSHQDSLTMADNTQKEMDNVDKAIKDSKDTINPTAYDAGYEAGQEYGKGFQEGLEDLYSQISSPEALEKTLRDRILVRQGYGTPEGADPNDPEVQEIQERRRQETESKLIARGFDLPSLGGFAKSEAKAAYRVAKSGGLRSWKDASVIGRIANAAEIGITEKSASKGLKALFSPKYGEEFGVQGGKHAIKKMFGIEATEAVAQAPTGKIVGAVDDALGVARGKGGKYVEKGLSKLGIEGTEGVTEGITKFVAKNFGDDAAKFLVKGGSKLAKAGAKAVPFVGTAITAATSIAEHNPFEKHYNEDGTEKRAFQSSGEVLGEIGGALASDVIGAVFGPVAGMAAGLVLEPIGEAIGGTWGWIADEVVNTDIKDIFAGGNALLGGVPGQIFDMMSNSPIGDIGRGIWGHLDGLTGGWLGDTWENVQNSSIAELTGLDQLGGALQSAGEWLFGGGEDEEGMPSPDQITDEQIAQLEQMGMLDTYMDKYGLNKEQADIMGQKMPQDKKVQNKNQTTVIIKNININTEDDPEKIKSALMNLIIEMQEQVSPRQVSRTVGEPPSVSTDASTDTNNQDQAEGQDEQNANGNTNTNTNPTT